MIQVTDLVKGRKVKLSDGQVTTIFGAYMSPTGLVITTKQSPDLIVERNVRVESIVEVLPDAG